MFQTKNFVNPSSGLKNVLTDFLTYNNTFLLTLLTLPLRHLYTFFCNTFLPTCLAMLHLIKV